MMKQYATLITSLAFLTAASKYYWNGHGTLSLVLSFIGGVIFLATLAIPPRKKQTL